MIEDIGGLYKAVRNEIIKEEYFCLNWMEALELLQSTTIKFAKN